MFTFITKLNAKTLVVADFNNGSDPLVIDSNGTVSTTDVAISTGSYTVHLSSESARGNRGYSYKIRHLTTGDGYITFGFGSTDLRGYRSLSFWIRGNAGSEHFKIDLRRATAPTEPSFRPNVR